jgi:hypothetical protein
MALPFWSNAYICNRSTDLPAAANTAVGVSSWTCYASKNARLTAADKFNAAKQAQRRCSSNMHLQLMLVCLRHHAGQCQCTRADRTTHLVNCCCCCCLLLLLLVPLLLLLLSHTSPTVTHAALLTTQHVLLIPSFAMLLPGPPPGQGEGPGGQAGPAAGGTGGSNSRRSCRPGV